MTRRQSLILVTFAACCSTAIFSSQPAFATGFDAGRIIDDAIFTNTTTMSASGVQSFLNSKVPSCDTNGTRPATEFGRGDISHAQYAAQRGWQSPPYTCLRDLNENGRSAAQIIYDTAQQYRINPQTLIVLLQKESSLVTDTWPLNVQYRAAMGYGCPDSGPNNSANCDASYYGFTNQMTWAAKMFRAIMDDSPTWYTPYNVGNNYIQWNPQAGCGGSNVYIQNRSTAALYNYTPYQPNSAALNAGYGLGDSCSAYGNRNFYLYFNDWFGSTSESPVRTWSVSTQGIISTNGSVVATNKINISPGRSASIYVKVKNTGNQTWYQSNTLFATSSPSDRSSEFADGSWYSNRRIVMMQEDNVKPGGYATFAFTMTAPNKLFSAREYFNIVHEGIAWENDIGFYYDIDVTLPKDNSINAIVTSNTLYTDPELKKPISNTENRVRVNTTLYGRMTFQNTGGATLNQSTLRLGTYGPTDRSSLLKSSDWLSDTRVASLDESIVSPGETGHMSYTIRTPDNAAGYAEDFALVVDGVAWVDATKTTLSVNVVNNYSDALSQDVLRSADTLVMSPNLLYRLVLQGDGNLVIYHNSRPIWASNTAGSPDPLLLLQNDGNLVLYARGGRAVWNSNSVSGRHSLLKLQNDGNLVLYADGNIPRWDSGTSGR